MFRNVRSDWRTYEGRWWEFGFWALLCYRFGRWRYKIRPRIVRLPFSVLYKIYYHVIQVLTGIEFPCEVEVGRNFRIDHHSGIIVSGYARFGDNCVIRQGVTVGLKDPKDPKAPQIGNDVDIGAGAKLLGDIHIGDNVSIGANAVVLEDVPSNSIAVGVPAKVVSR